MPLRYFLLFIFPIFAQANANLESFKNLKIKDVFGISKPVIWKHRWQNNVLDMSLWKDEKPGLVLPLHDNLDSLIKNDYIHRFPGAEIDIMWNEKIGKILVSHDNLQNPDIFQSYAGKYLSLEEFIKALKAKSYKGYLWFDLKNIDTKNAERISQELQSIKIKYSLEKFFIESNDLEALKILKEKGFYVCYWFIVHKNAKSKEEIQQRIDIAQIQPHYLSVRLEDYLGVAKDYQHLNIATWTNDHDNEEAIAKKLPLGVKIFLQKKD